MSASARNVPDDVSDDVAAVGTGRIAASVLAVVFGLFFALAELAAISNLVALPEWYAVLGIADATPWALLILGVAVPAFLYVVALLVCRGRALLARALVWAAALGVTHALALSLFTLVSLLQPALT